jgi:hypothetical protein
VAAQLPVRRTRVNQAAYVSARAGRKVRSGFPRRHCRRRERRRVRLQLADKSIQPVWVEVENNEDVPWLDAARGLDPDFIPASGRRSDGTRTHASELIAVSASWPSGIGSSRRNGVGLVLMNLAGR